MQYPSSSQSAAFVKDCVLLNILTRLLFLIKLIFVVIKIMQHVLSIEPNLSWTESILFTQSKLQLAGASDPINSWQIDQVPSFIFILPNIPFYSEMSHYESNWNVVWCWLNTSSYKVYWLLNHLLKISWGIKHCFFMFERSDCSEG